MRIFKTKAFDRFARAERIGDDTLRRTVADMEAGRIDANLGGSVFKQRVARTGRGKSGGYRCVIVYRLADVVFFVYGYSKNRRANIEPDELRAFRDLAGILLKLTEGDLTAMLEDGQLMEVTPHGANEDV